MKLLVCIEDRGGMAFNGRRESRDRIVIADMIMEAQEQLYVERFSEKLFEGKDGVIVIDNVLTDAPEDATVFLEDRGPGGFEAKIDEVVIYYWNKVYPYDVVMDLDMDQYMLKDSREFKGYSHEKITKETYVKFSRPWDQVEEVEIVTEDENEE